MDRRCNGGLSRPRQTGQASYGLSACRQPGRVRCNGRFELHAESAPAANGMDKDWRGWWGVPPARPAAGMQGDALSVVTVEPRGAAGKLYFSVSPFGFLRLAAPSGHHPSISAPSSLAAAWPLSGWLWVEAASDLICRRSRRARSIPPASIPHSKESDSSRLSAAAMLFAAAELSVDMVC